MSSTAACHAVAYAKAGSGRLTTASPSCGGRACHAEALAKAGRLRFSLLWRSPRRPWKLLRGLVTGLLPYLGLEA